MTRTKFIIILIAAAILGVVAKIGHFGYMSAKVQRLEPIMVQEALRLAQDPETIELFVPEPLEFSSSVVIRYGFPVDPVIDKDGFSIFLSNKFKYLDQSGVPTKPFKLKFFSSTEKFINFKHYETTLSICGTKICPYDPSSTREITNEEYWKFSDSAIKADELIEETITIPMPDDNDNIFDLQAKIHRNFDRQILSITYVLRRKNYTLEEILDQWVMQYINPRPEEQSLFQYHYVQTVYLPYGMMIL